MAKSNTPESQSNSKETSKTTLRKSSAPPRRGGDLLIVDNSDTNWRAIDYLREWTQISHQFDIASGYFEIGALLALDEDWQRLDKIRILMGDEVSKRTRAAFEAALQGLKSKLDDSIEAEKDKNDFLEGVPAIVEAIKSGKIEARVYKKKKFHAKAYITHAKLAVVGSAALVGSSNFTYPGLTENIELNVQMKQDVEELQEWYETYWEDAEDVTVELLQVIERHIQEYSPYDVYRRAMAAYFRSHELSVGEWERTSSIMYGVLSQYQREGYHHLMQINAKYNGALLCDGVGLGKTFIGLMVIERLLFERKKVALFVPKAAREDVWEAKLNRYLPQASGLFSNLVIFNHTDLLRGGKFEGHMQEVAEEVDAIIVDEAHNFRNFSSRRARKFFEISKDKQLFLLTATPINNSLFDLMHLIEFFSRRQSDYFKDAPLGIHSLQGHFRKMETALKVLVGEKEADEDTLVELDSLDAEEVLAQDDLFQALVVQRSRAYVKRSLSQEESRDVHFPQRKDPQVQPYSLKKTYGSLLKSLKSAFNKEKPLITLPMYYPLNYKKDKSDVDAMDEGRQMQVVGLIRTLLLKRFESSAVSFQASCEDLLLKLLLFVRVHDEKRAERWEGTHQSLLDRISEHRKQRTAADSIEDEEELEEDIIPEEFKKKVIELPHSEFDIPTLVMDTLMDMDQLAAFLEELKHFSPEKDDKLQNLISLLQTDPILKNHKVLIFTEYQTTARYLFRELQKAGIGPLSQVDSARANASEAVHAFAPFYNESSSAELASEGAQEIRVLISTDVLSEGLNLQDAACIINYDLHWNPVRLMQRIGRVDRRLDPQIEERIIAEHPTAAEVRGSVYLWNFLPPEELNDILSLYARVSHKTLRISKTFGIEGRKLLTPEDEYEALKEFNKAYEGTTTRAEEMYLAYQQLAQDHPDLSEIIARMPLRLFSGRESDLLNSRAVFFCYRLPNKNAQTGEWEEDAGFTRWYLYDLENEKIIEQAAEIFPLIRCLPETPRRVKQKRPALAEIRQQINRHITQTYLKKVQAPVGVQQTLLAWMAIN